GALEIGTLVSFMLYGVTMTQAYIYYHHFPDDPPKLKALVAFIVVCEGAHAICIGHGLYTYTILDYGQPERLGYALPKSIVVGALPTHPCLLVQGFFTFRTHVFTKCLCTCFIISGMMFLRFLAMSAVFSLALGMTLLVPFVAQWGWLLIVASIGSAVTDLTIAALFFIILLELQKTPTSCMSRTMALVDKIIAWTIG
ncbi:hypothetical protein C8R45DRAFT_842290, partial [Mycena sanguinolenta]